MSSEVEVVELHKCPSLMNECCDLLNSEWKRSITARMHSLEKSGDVLPTSLILVATNNDKKEVIGHSRLSIFTSDPDGCLIESVLIKNERRGEGLGKFLMERTEAHAKRLGYKTVYLTTIDKQGFYEHLGYNHFKYENLLYHQYGKNISSFTYSSVNQNKESKQQEIINDGKITTTVLDSKFKELSLLQSPPSLPSPSPGSFPPLHFSLLPPSPASFPPLHFSLPPPPPPLLISPFKNIFNRETTWMKKTL